MITAIHNNLLNIEANAIINPANVSLLHGGGLCEVNHRSAGEELEKHCRRFPRQQLGSTVMSSAACKIAHILLMPLARACCMASTKKQ